MATYDSRVTSAERADQCETATPPATGAPSRRRPRLLRHWHLPVTLIVLVAVYLNLRGHLPTAHAVGVAFASARAGRIAVAAGCQAVSLAMFAYQQRWLLRAVGAGMSVPRAMAVTYARMAIVISMPADTAPPAGSWLLIPLGGLAWFGLRRPARHRT
jgi:uncharacterized membrane protein YbhN (UPF0104 family)